MLFFWSQFTGNYHRLWLTQYTKGKLLVPAHDCDYDTHTLIKISLAYQNDSSKTRVFEKRGDPECKHMTK